MGEIKSPVCPMCGELPMLVMGGWQIDIRPSGEIRDEDEAGCE